MPFNLTCLKSGDTVIPGMFKPFALKMEEKGIPPIVINIFKCYYANLVYGAQGKISESEIAPAGGEDVRPYADLARYAKPGIEALRNVVVIKLNGGLGTSMGLEKAKSLITVRDGLNFLDLILQQTLRLREKYKVALPLTFMNSFKTHLDTMMRIEDFDRGPAHLPLAFVQHRYPKILEKTLAPAEWPANPELEWNPPGHGDFYTALVTSGLLEKLLAKGIHYAFVSNSDNLGAIMDERILGLLAVEGLDFVMEVAERTASDKKGGHLARYEKNGRLILRELAQCPACDADAFQDIDKYRYFNTNSLWMDLRAVERVFIENRMMPLDMIVNSKTLDPRDPQSPEVFQIETAMGSAISAFDKAKAVCVPRNRFAPVKTTGDLLAVMSDSFVRTKDDTIVPNPRRKTPLPLISLDPKFYKKIDDFSARFPDGAPSMMQCSSLTVEGDVVFGKGVKLSGEAHVVNKARLQARIKPGTKISGEYKAS
ncbi:MAG: UTP--glucose-1-phosphate uridylyltransferase [Desulfovibrionaceae bacterium]|nr:UTP--glucose-1-phosphate uridylyltransferase [Desulfovibrionaceae bacterium]MBF0513483.1 UTP--glucose-1-phosphate uridylyltransferase [Desulfovibrionaceae bacterium]